MRCVRQVTDAVLVTATDAAGIRRALAEIAAEGLPATLDAEQIRAILSDTQRATQDATLDWEVC